MLQTYIYVLSAAIFMRLKLHLHTTLPHDAGIPNAALGYLKSALSAYVDVTNVYWYLVPKELMDMLSKTLDKIQSSRIHESHKSPLFTAYMARTFYDKPILQPTIIQSILTSYTSLKKIEKTAKAFKRHVDHTIENSSMADVDIAGFTVKLYQWVINRYIWKKLKEENPNITIVVGGLDTKEEAFTLMRMFNDIDCAVYGEGEYSLQQLVQSDTLAEVPQVVYRDDHLCSTDAASMPVDVPFADHSDYFEQIQKYGLNLSPQIPIISTRSCRWNKCKFCNLFKGSDYRERPVTTVVKEIEYQSKKHECNRFFFSDSDIGRKSYEGFKELLATLLESAVNRKMPYIVGAEISPTRLTRETVEMMSNIRIDVQIGFEALTDSLLKNMNKMHGFSENVQALKFGNDCDMGMSGLNILRNLPGESKEDVIESLKNVQFLRFFLKKYELSPSELVLYKGAPYYAEMPCKEREEWVINSLYDELEQMGLIDKEDRWDFFGFTARYLKHSWYWGHVLDVLEKMHTSDIWYSWLLFPDGSSFIEERNTVSGSKKYILDTVETQILIMCDSITHKNSLHAAFPHEDIDAIIAQLQRENLLYVDDKDRLISVVSTKKMKNVERNF